MTPEEIKNFKEWNVPLPTRDVHGTAEDVESKHLQKAKPQSWRMEGNKLMADVPGGVMAQYIPTDYILTGTDDDGMPILTKVKL